MLDQYTTQRLSLNSLTAEHLDFIFELVNMPEWIRFIGNRNITDQYEARYYIQKIIDNPNIHYWVVSSKEDAVPLGVITFIKRDYFDHFDLGFAFLKRFTGKGYAYEAAEVILREALLEPAHTRVLAISLKENVSSLALLEKLNFKFEKEIIEEEEELRLYAIDKV